MPFEPRGLESQKNPLKHRFTYGFGLSAKTSTDNSAWITLMRHTKECVSPEAVLVNPHHASMDIDTGPAVYPMSIIERMKIVLSFSRSTTNSTSPIKFWWMPFFCSFPEKYTAANANGTSVAALMSLTTDDTNEDVVPLTTNKLPVEGTSERPQPASTVGFTEVFGTYNMTTDLAMEDAPFNSDNFWRFITTSEAKGALKSCLGRVRHVSFQGSGQNLSKTFFLKKFVPRSIRRSLPFGFFGILVHVPLELDIDQYYQATGLTADVAHIGVKCTVTFDEWNEEFDNSHT